ncbi:MAG: amidohydrolase family protein [Chloroflexi bacterium]|nr:amidohydrolase family protein [Chloroflexota bacterium]
MNRNRHSLSRRDFLKMAAVGAGGALLASCQRGVRVTAIPPTSLPIPTLPPGSQATTILVNGRVAVMDSANTIAQAVAIAGDKVMATGLDDAIRALATPQTQVIDLGGRSVTPGFVDAHNHMYAKGLIGTAYIDVNPPVVTTVEELQAKIAEGCAAKGSGKWVILQGYISYDGEYPDKNMIDPASPDNPVMLINQGGHMGAVNTYALDLAGVTASTPDPKFGKLVRDENGEPTGALVNHSAMDIFRIYWKDEVLTPEIKYQAIVQPQAEFISYGITSIGDVNVRGLEAMQAYFDAGSNNAMSLRAYILNTIEYYSEVDGRADEVNAMLYEDNLLRLGGYKFLVDGAVEAAYTYEPHNGLSWDMATWDPRALKEAASVFHDLGYQCSFHVIGDAAVDMALDAIEYAMGKNPRPDPRHRLEHVILSTDEALERQRDLGVIISTQPHGIRLLGDHLIEQWGEERASRMVPTRTWLDLGVPLSISSDCPTLPWWQPQPIVAAAVTRLTGSNQVIGPDQVLTVDEAMRAYTMGGAYAMFEENIKGSLEPGKYADLVVWRLDPFVATLDEMMAEHPIEKTMIGGEVVFEKQ